MKRLFQIRDGTTGQLLPAYYSDKQAAKRARDALEGPRTDDAPRRYTVTPGPDHWRHEGERNEGKAGLGREVPGVA